MEYLHALEIMEKTQGQLYWFTALMIQGILSDDIGSHSSKVAGSLFYLGFVHSLQSCMYGMLFMLPSPFQSLYPYPFLMCFDLVTYDITRNKH